ncbi:MAG: hypothetical protein IMZ52_01390 [Actinobacteria bacterium]|nr:hypothetical protein [Actinomycetota bacterium]
MINEIKLKVTIPETELCISQMQPFVELGTSEPYRWQPDKINKQLARIYRFMEIAKTFDSNGKSHFTLLPEYSIPGINGIDRINQILSDASWPSDTIVIGGVDGLSNEDYVTICNDAISCISTENAPNQIIDKKKWVNCCITWVKETSGLLKRYIQPKISRSWPEINVYDREMFCGCSVNLFTIKFSNGTDCKFLTLICFDWIGLINGTGNGIFEILNCINQKWRVSGSAKDINLIFILQKNPKPNHRNFLDNAHHFFVDRNNNPFIRRDNSVLFFVNTAGEDKPGKTNKYGYSSLIASKRSPYYDKDCCPLSFSLDTKKLRNSDYLDKCKEALFRENGACFHLFKFAPPSFISGNSGAKGLFLSEARVYSIDEGIDDPRVPNGTVAASIKWVNDEIDTIEPITIHENGKPIQNEVIQAHEDVSKEIRKLSGKCLCKCIQYSFCKYSNFKPETIPIVHFVDEWGNEEKVGLQTVIHTLSIIRTCNTINISEAKAHATMNIGTNVFDIIIVHGGNNPKDCFDYGKKFLIPNSSSRYAVVVTKDINNSLVNKKIDRTIFYNQEPVSEKGPNITNPDDNFIHCGYQNIQECCFSAKSVDDLKKQIDCLLEV